uniref:Cytochrome c oxidase subunit 2 n=1 Tax=Sycon ciliatum TaxID=27933 RepID=A0A140CUU9_9METZ|nr:cytochrome c oxidase subunit 2 [Sycon ciliatum]
MIGSAFWGSLGWPSPAGGSAEAVLLLHDRVAFLLCAVSWVLFLVRSAYAWGWRSLGHRRLMEDWVLEMAWTIFPMLALVRLGFPSLRLLYFQEERFSAAYGVRIVGHQWFWEYDYPGGWLSRSDSVPTLAAGFRRLSGVSAPLFLPVGVRCRRLVTSADVLHSFSLPACGVKVDAVPGRLNSLCFFVHRPGFFYGQCSELCGANHTFMPVLAYRLPCELF